MKTGAVVVAAGLSSRMGEWKALLPYEETTISRHIIMQLKKLELDPILVVTGHRSDELEAHLFDMGVRFLKNEHYAGNQMFDSYRMGIQEIADSCDRILFMPIDKPAIRMQTFRRILEIDAELVRTTWKGEPGHPLLIKSETAKKLCSYIGNRGMRGAMEESGVSITNLCVKDQGTVWDLDTPEEYQTMMQRKEAEKKGVRSLVKVQLKLDEIFFGPGAAELMEWIQRTGSIQLACERMELSYSKGSKIIRRAEKQLGLRILERKIGGIGGGGSHLTEEGRLLVECYRELESMAAEDVRDLYRDYFEETFFPGIKKIRKRKL